jgi:nitrite reductase/ring-hydroxylating ferredoxin subunit
MNYSNITAKSVGLGYTESVTLDQVSKRVMNGEVIVIPKCMQAIGFFERMKEATLEAIRETIGESKAAQIREKGFEAIHEIITLDELIAISSRTYLVFHSLAPSLSKLLVKEIFQSKQPFYLEESPNVRFYVPYDVTVENKKEFSKFRWHGKVTPHGPHHDSWYQCPTNCVNVWIAVGSVKVGNGLTIFPEAYGKRLLCTEDGTILRNQYCGSAINFELEPGDALIFHGEHLHSSEINSTDSARYVVSLRMTLEKPNFIDQSPYKNNYVYVEPTEGLVLALNQFLANTFRKLVKQFNSYRNRSKTPNYVISTSNVSLFDDTSADFPKPIPVQTVEGHSHNETKLVFDYSELPIGTIKPISQKMCVARLDENRVVAFNRHCPHEGADLAGGYLRDGCLVCPWHNLPFNLESGTSPCQSLSKLTIFDCAENSNKVEVGSAD